MSNGTEVYYLTSMQGALQLATKPSPLDVDTTHELILNLSWDSYGSSVMFTYSGGYVNPRLLAYIPYWLVLLLTGTIPAISGFKRLRKNRPRDTGVCPVCGYDLRATPKRCPECGFVPSTKEAASQANLAELLTQLPTGKRPEFDERSPRE